MKKLIAISLLMVLSSVVLLANGTPEDRGARGSRYDAARGGNGNMNQVDPEAGRVEKRGFGNGAAAGATGRYGTAAGAGGPADDRFAESIQELLEGYEMSDLSDEESAGLLFMFEEEKLARDVYSALYDVWNYPIFSNIARSEQQHMDTIDALLERYQIENSSDPEERGAFESGDLAQLYTKLVEQGQNSLLDAFTVGATIEDLDIADLQSYTEATDNDDIAVAYLNLAKGSRNHLRSFAAQIARVGEAYSAQYIDEDYLALILETARETDVVTDPQYRF